MAIKSFRSKALAELFHHGRKAKLDAGVAKTATRLMDHLDAAVSLRDVRIAGFHELKGKRTGTYSWRVTGNLRMTFRFSAGDALDVDLEDYH